MAELADVEAQIAADGDGRPGRPGKSKRGRKPGKRGPGRPANSKRGPAKRRKTKQPKATQRKARRTGRKGAAKPEGTSELHGLIRGALTGASEPLKATAIAKKVVDGGYKTKSKVFHLIVGQRLAEMKGVKKPARGLYALA